jgi:hypothetical protein
MLLMALAIYLLFRPQGLFNGTFNFTHLVSGCTLPQWLVDSMPDALWYASLMCFQIPLDFSRSLARQSVTILACATGPLHELLQYLAVVPGTYCRYDMTAYFTILITYLIICLIKYLKRFRC